MSVNITKPGWGITRTGEVRAIVFRKSSTFEWLTISASGNCAWVGSNGRYWGYEVPVDDPDDIVRLFDGPSSIPQNSEDWPVAPPTDAGAEA